MLDSPKRKDTDPCDRILEIIKIRRERIEDFMRRYGVTQFDEGRVHELKHLERVMVENAEPREGGSDDR